MAAAEEPADLFGDDGEEGLFGDEEEDDQSGQERKLSDEELDSGDDYGRYDKAPSQTEGIPRLSDHNLIADCDISRQDVPRPTDGELHLLRLPTFLGIDPLEYRASEFKIPQVDHHSSESSQNFSAYSTAKTTIRYRKDAKGKVESNAVVNKWSDGTYTLLLGDTHYVLEGNPLAPSAAQGHKTYQDHLDSHQYLATPYLHAQVLHIIGHVTNQFTVRPTKEIEDQALAKLESSLAAAARGRTKGDNKDGLALISSNQDPELHRKALEEADKAKMREARRKENQTLRADQQAGRIRGPGSGLHLNDLERGSRITGSKKKRSAPSAPRRARRRADYSSDEDDIPRGKNREDEYDMEDGFLAPSDEEGEEESGDESEEEAEEESEEESPKAKKQKVDKKATAEVDSDVDAEGEIDDAVPQESMIGDLTSGRGRRRLVIEDDDDE